MPSPYESMLNEKTSMPIQGMERGPQRPMVQPEDAGIWTKILRALRPKTAGNDFDMERFQKVINAPPKSTY